jgi:hypothetical protein
MRYGNRAFRQWHARLVRNAVPISRRVIDAAAGPAAPGAAAAAPAGGSSPRAHEGAEVELAAYLVDAFGNSTRIDYGTGHETNFFVFLYCLGRLGLLTPADLPALALRAFPAYLRVARRLQRTYWLEPAGSHGVWSLDDYHLLAFVIGSAQLLNHRQLRPRAVLDRELVDDFARDYIYLAAVKAICEVKSGAPFAEHSPILADLASLPTWAKVNEQLAKLFRSEVLGKLPVAQHLVFGSLFPFPQDGAACSRAPCPSDACAHLFALLDGADPDAVSSPEGADEVPIDHPDAAAAPWVTSAVCTHAHHHHVAHPCGQCGAVAGEGSGGGGPRPQPPSTITGVAPWAAAGGARPQPPVTITGVAPWAKK